MTKELFIHAKNMLWPIPLRPGGIFKPKTEGNKTDMNSEEFPNESIFQIWDLELTRRQKNIAKPTTLL